MSLDIFKLEKLKILAYDNRERSGMPIGTFEAMFNPESFSQKFEIQYGRGQGMNSSDQEAVYSYNRPSDLTLNLILDGTGVHEMGILQLGTQKTVAERFEEFLQLTFRMNGDIHEPNFLVVEWGELNFSCRLGTVNVSYTSFDRDGKPLRAELEVTLLSDTEVTKRLNQENQMSADLTPGRLVRNGDTLPLMTKAVYGSSAHYLEVARFNDLDDFRNLTPGLEIFFPPLESFKS